MLTKFRAWNKVEKKYYYKSLDFVMWNLGEDVTCSEIGMTTEEYMEKQNWIGFDDLDKLYWIIEPYIGIDDINGKEIYLNDYVIDHDEVRLMNKKHYSHYFGKVYYDEETASFNIEGFYRGYYEYPTLAFSERNDKLEVIGNVHEGLTKEK